MMLGSGEVIDGAHKMRRVLKYFHLTRVLKYFSLERVLKYFSKSSFPGERGPTTKLYLLTTGREIKRVHVHLIICTTKQYLPL